MGNNTEIEELFLAAKQLGIEPKEARKLMRANVILSNPIVSTILGLIVGIALGALFPRVTTIWTYPYVHSQVIVGIGATRGQKQSSTMLALVLGVVGFIVGFAVSSQLIFARTYRNSIMYGVYSRKNR
ncbi:MAG: hypothetical protein JSV29_02385 [Candidatus Bathyarchaeota archaeon]|nr:MAG: hypothetical protein JSV29_02385 [Candidatus Bathyarchaeota archaeon]